MIPSGYAYYVRVRTLAVLSTTTTAVRYAYSAVPAGTAYDSRYSCSCSNSDLQNTASLLAGPGVIHHTKPSQQVETLHIRRASKAPHLVAGQGNTLVVINQAGFAARARSPPPPGPLAPALRSLARTLIPNEWSPYLNNDVVDVAHPFRDRTRPYLPRPRGCGGVHRHVAGGQSERW
jgi:hypothetical protein